MIQEADVAHEYTQLRPIARLFLVSEDAFRPVGISSQNKQPSLALSKLGRACRRSLRFFFDALEAIRWRYRHQQ